MSPTDDGHRRNTLLHSIEEMRNSLIIDDVIGAIEGNRSPIILSERRAHVEFLAEQLAEVVRRVIVLQGA